MKKLIPLFIILILFGMAYAQLTYNISTSGMDKPFLLQNPSASAISGWAFSIDYYRPYAGIGESIGEGDFTIAWGNNNWGFSLEQDYLSTPVYYRSSILGGISKRINSISVGISPKIIFDGFKRDNFNYRDTDNLLDPFFDNSSSTAFTFNLGTSFQKDRLKTGITANNIIPIDLANNSSDGFITDATKIDLGLNYLFPQLLTVTGISLSYKLDSPNEKNIGYGIGIQNSSISQSLLLRGGLNNNQLSLGFGVNLPSFPEFDFNYAFVYPLSDVGRVASSHLVGISGKIKPKERRAELSIKCLNRTPKVAVGNSSTLEIKVINSGNLTVKNLDIAVLEDTEIIATEQIDRLDGKDDTTIQLEIPTLNEGITPLTIIVDIYNKIEEEDKSDNRCELYIESVGEPELTVSATPNVLQIEQISYISQDRPVIPYIFFEKNSSDIHSRFDKHLGLFKQRLEDNPDVKLYIRGYIAPDETDISLPFLRANSVMEKLGNKPNQIILPDDYDIAKFRVPEKGRSKNETQMLLDENRRVELSAELYEDFYYQIKYGEIPDIDYPRLNSLLERNKDIALVISADNLQEDFPTALNSALKIKEIILQNIDRRFTERVFASAEMKGTGDQIEIFLSPDGLLYKPSVVYTSKEFTPNVFPSAIIKMNTDIDSVESWSLSLVDTDSVEVFRIGEGKDNLPDSIFWDFRTPKGDPIPTTDRFSIQGKIVDNFNREITSYSTQDIYVEIKQKEERTERILLVQFVFNEPEAQSRYLEDRLEIVARRVIDIILQSNKSTITIEGHTDIIGNPERNKRLSEERAKAVRELLEKTISEILGLKRADMNQWLVENNARIIDKGFSSSVQYAIEIRENDSTFTDVIGDNSLPEGRTINRRVLVTIESEKLRK